MSKENEMPGPPPGRTEVDNPAPSPAVTPAPTGLTPTKTVDIVQGQDGKFYEVPTLHYPPPNAPTGRKVVSPEDIQRRIREAHKRAKDKKGPPKKP